MTSCFTRTPCEIYYWKLWERILDLKLVSVIFHNEAPPQLKLFLKCSVRGSGNASLFTVFLKWYGVTSVRLINFELKYSGVSWLRALYIRIDKSTLRSYSSLRQLSAWKSSFRLASLFAPDNLLSFLMYLIYRNVVFRSGEDVRPRSLVPSIAESLLTSVRSCSPI